MELDPDGSPASDTPTDCPRFPAIAVCPGDSFGVVGSMDQLEAASEGALRSRYYERPYLFDSDGRRWRVAHFEKSGARPRGPFGCARSGAAVGIRLFFGKPDHPSISHIVDDLCKLVDADPDDLYGQFVSCEDLKTLFRSSSDAERLVTVAATLGGP